MSHLRPNVVVAFQDHQGRRRLGRVVGKESNHKVYGPNVWVVVDQHRQTWRLAHDDMTETSVKDVLDFKKAVAEQGNWVPASGGTEPVFTARSGKRLQYVYQPSTGKHAYLDVDSDLILSDEEARLHLGRAGGRAGRLDGVSVFTHLLAGGVGYGVARAVEKPEQTRALALAAGEKIKSEGQRAYASAKTIAGRAGGGGFLGAPRGSSSRVRPGDRVRFVDARGTTRSGRVVMASSHHGAWVVNIGGRRGTPMVVDEVDLVVIGTVARADKTGRASGRAERFYVYRGDDKLLGSVQVTEAGNEGSITEPFIAAFVRKGWLSAGPHELIDLDGDPGESYGLVMTVRPRRLKARTFIIRRKASA